MKNIIFSIIFLVTVSFVSCNKPSNTTSSKTIENSKEITFGVRGNCGMCKKTIEKAANSLEGVSSAVWNMDQKTIVVSYDSINTKAMTIHNAIAASGYDTEKVLGDVEAYNSLPGCCQYDHDMEMNQTAEQE